MVLGHGSRRRFGGDLSPRAPAPPGSAGNPACPPWRWELKALCAEELCLFLSCVIPPSSVSSLNTSVHFCGRPVPSPSPWVPSISSVSHPPLCLYLCLFHVIFLCCRLCKVSTGLPATSFCLSFRLISRRLSDAHGQYLHLCGCLLPPALSSILCLPVPFSPRISFLLNVLCFRSLTFSPTVSSLFLPCHPLFSFFFSSLQNSMIFFSGLPKLIL